MYAMFATLPDHTVAKGLTFEDYGDAVAHWTELDNARLAGQFPQVKFFEVRDENDPKYAGAKRLTTAFTRVITPRGFGEGQGLYTGQEKAARAAWRLFVPHARGVRQGSGGWFYDSHGNPVAQGLTALAKRCVIHNLIVRGADGRWYVTEVANLAHFEQVKAVA